MRTDRDITSIGKVADLVPTAPIMAVGDHGTIGQDLFVVGGRLQLDHGRGPWDEWYVEINGNRWGWLAKAQGKFYLTFPVGSAVSSQSATESQSLISSGPTHTESTHTDRESVDVGIGAADVDALPSWEQMQPGSQGVLVGAGDALWTVQERGGSALLSAEGELPLPAVPGESGRYVDAGGPDGAFATIDYGDGSEPPVLYVGRELAPDEVRFHDGGGQRVTQTLTAGKVECPTCGAPVEIHTPETTERAACQSCYSLLDVTQGHLQLVHKLNQPKIVPLIPLGAVGKLPSNTNADDADTDDADTDDAEEVMCIGLMQRHTVVQGVTYAWREYLLHGKSGYQWLTEDAGHWTHLRSAKIADVKVRGSVVLHRGKKHKLFSTAQSVVDFVVGEFYWRVQVGDQASLIDYVAPPCVVSEERTANESTWSQGNYITGKALWAAFELEGHPPRAVGVGVAQPNPHGFRVASAIWLALTLLLCVLSVVIDLAPTGQALVDGPVQMAPIASPVSGGSDGTHTVFTPVFTVPSKGALQVELSTTANNQWVGMACALVNQQNAKVHEFFVETGYYHGISGGESWTEGSKDSTLYLSAIPAGSYFMRIDPMWQSHAQVGAFNSPTQSAPTASLKVTHGKRGYTCLCCSGFLLFLPWVIIAVLSRRFESRRKENSNLYA